MGRRNRVGGHRLAATLCTRAALHPRRPARSIAEESTAVARQGRLDGSPGAQADHGVVDAGAPGRAPSGGAPDSADWAEARQVLAAGGARGRLVLLT